MHRDLCPVLYIYHSIELIQLHRMRYASLLAQFREGIVKGNTVSESGFLGFGFWSNTTYVYSTDIYIYTRCGRSNRTERYFQMNAHFKPTDIFVVVQYKFKFQSHFNDYNEENPEECWFIKKMLVAIRFYLMQMFKMMSLGCNTAPATTNDTSAYFCASFSCNFLPFFFNALLQLRICFRLVPVNSVFQYTPEKKNLEGTCQEIEPATQSDLDALSTDWENDRRASCGPR